MVAGVNNVSDGLAWDWKNGDGKHGFSPHAKMARGKRFYPAPAPLLRRVLPTRHHVHHHLAGAEGRPGRLTLFRAGLAVGIHPAVFGQEGVNLRGPGRFLRHRVARDAVLPAGVQGTVGIIDSPTPRLAVVGRVRLPLIDLTAPDGVSSALFQNSENNSQAVSVSGQTGGTRPDVSACRPLSVSSWSRVNKPACSSESMVAVKPPA